MRIDLDHSTQPLSQSDRTSTPKSQAAGASGAGVNNLASQDQSQFATAPAQEQALADQFQEVRAERVRALRLAVQGGNYRPSAKNVAEAIVSYIRMEPPDQLRSGRGETPMGNGDLSTDLSVERLQPPASVPAAQNPAMNRDLPRAARAGFGQKKED